MHHPTDRITHTTAFVTPVVEHWLEREIAQWVHPMKDRSDDPSHHERTLYLWAMSHSPKSDKFNNTQPVIHTLKNIPKNPTNKQTPPPTKQTYKQCLRFGRKEGNVSFNDALNTFYLRLYGVRHKVKDHSDSEKGNPLPPHRLLFTINSKGSFICTIPQTG